MGRLKQAPRLLSSAPPVVKGLSREEWGAVRDAARAADTENTGRGWYNTARWRRRRQEVLGAAGWMCQGCNVPHQLNEIRHDRWSAVVDHIEPHRGDEQLFWDRSNLQAVCKEFHDGEKKKREYAARKHRGGGVQRK
tara:strand:- start:654 stop:1064 length:411 start_codon:yes stop_codon:yes gene_type:complete